MVGRGEELTAILSRLRRGVGTVVVGEAGLGKSVLAREVRRQLDAGGLRTQLVLCSRGSDFPLQMVTEAVASGNLELLVVDDAHLLDEDSAELLWQIGRAHV